ncbi:cell division FtsA domain-containing protein [Crassaminicella indica]|uniref:Rod shape-determining protein n=1 Tax=Crassaminicella indica TaxID=2855394 RepID=A0ABX8R9A6_9CLOT|nr:cell division FtsA domain-containing protein [Crassaminicella indica]QXM05640.1 rod shape-determining protein [Crassaminicella indica]
MTDSTLTKISPHEAIFSLDIGTKSVVGIIAKKEDEKFMVIDVEMMEYSSRAMYDGQIHDIDKVAQVAKKVKEKLENRLGFKLTRVAIAAAGRALKTCRVQVSREIDSTKEIEQGTINSLEIEGIQKAQEMLDNKISSKDTKYYCVGYTVVNYYLDDNMITSLKGHRGDKIQADILATFLPHIVVDSLYSVMNKIGLEVIHLTLEPIAAIHVAIPPKLRLLNLALVDIGAGTSDIAITQDGTVVSYAMASIAGDEITEAIAKEFLLDFDTAERLKVELNKKDSHTFEDIVGIPYTMTTEEIVDKIAPVIEKLAFEIAEKVIQYNGKSPSAVFCIGGGSQIPTLTKYLADKLGLRPERVAIRGTEIIENIEFLCKQLEGPEFITPIGIGIISVKDGDDNFIEISVNEELIKLFNTKKLFVSDALIRAGINAKRLIARRGKNLNIYINGQIKTIKGSFGEPAKIYLNGKLSSLDEEINHKDQIKIEWAIDGVDASISLKDLIKDINSINFNGLDIHLMNKLLVNGKEVPMDYKIMDGDHITFEEIHTVEELLKRFNVDYQKTIVRVNGVEVEKAYRLKHKDEIVTLDRKAAVSVNENKVENNKIKVSINGQAIEIPKKNRELIFVDIFDYFDFDRTKVKGILIMKLNGKKVGYTDPIKNGDDIEIYWKNN